MLKDIEAITIIMGLFNYRIKNYLFITTFVKKYSFVSSTVRLNKTNIILTCNFNHSYRCVKTCF